MKFLNIYKDTKSQAEQALLSTWTPGNNHKMRQAFKDLFERECLLAEPVFQSSFGWQTTDSDIWRNYLSPSMVDKLGIFTDYAPYTHQVESWMHLDDAQGQRESFLCFHDRLRAVSSQKDERKHGRRLQLLGFRFPMFPEALQSGLRIQRSE